jgi:hypothetical protein
MYVLNQGNLFAPQKLAVMKNVIFTLFLFSLLLVLSCSRKATKSAGVLSEDKFETEAYTKGEYKGPVTETKPETAPVPPTEAKDAPPAGDPIRSKAPDMYEKSEVKSDGLLKKSLEGRATEGYFAMPEPSPSGTSSSGTYTRKSYLDASDSYSRGDDAYSYKTPVKYEKGFESETYKNSIGNAGILTAGELHDFSKWNLWTDIATDALSQYQKEWTIRPMERYSVQVGTDKGRPVVDAEVELLAEGGTVVWTGRTDNTGKAELWADMYESRTYIKQPEYTIRIKYQGRTVTKKANAFGDNGLNHITLSTPCNISNSVDALFVVDATGSMSDEINYLKSELNSIIGKFKQQNEDLNLRTGSVFYRDNTDEYLTRQSEFSDDPFKTVDFIQNQYADGGGDYPEAVEAALDAAMKMNWSPEARTRLLFLVLDAPPHQTPEVKESLWKSINLAAKQGIRIIPITASGIDKATEYLMRSMALATNGTYVFLTNHSGVGNPHIEPTTDSYDVEKLNDLMLRLFTQFTYAPDCKEQPTSDLQSDTLRIFNPMTNIPVDTLATASNDSNDLTIKQGRDSALVINPNDPPKPEALVCYPNPTRGLLNVEVISDMKEVYLADVSGKLIEKYLVSEQKILKLRLDNYPAGMYFLKCEVNGHWLSGKVVLVR